MKVILSSNPYRDRGLKAALEAQRILERSGAQTALCLPFVPKKGDRVDVPRQLTLSSLERELPSADLLICFGGDGTILMRPGTPRFTMCRFWGSIWAAWALWRNWSGPSSLCWLRWPRETFLSRSG